MQSILLLSALLAAAGSGLAHCSQVAADSQVNSSPIIQANGNSSAGVIQQDEDKLKLGVYIESLCPDSRRFFLNQLVPTYASIGDLFEPMIVPFGHARVLPNNKMICQHGQRECEGNRRQACIQARATSYKQQVDTIGCLFEANQRSASECVKEFMPAGVSFEAIEACTRGDESYKLMVANEKATGRVGYVPHLTLNGEHSDSIQEEAEHDLKNFLCKHYKGSRKPAGCSA